METRNDDQHISFILASFLGIGSGQMKVNQKIPLKNQQIFVPI